MRLRENKIVTDPNRQLFWIVLLSLMLALSWTAQSWLRWSHFGYKTFDLAFYVQALTEFSHGRNWSSLLGLKPFGNHADFIILLIWPFFAWFSHPMVLVIAQNLALASCLPLSFQIARWLGQGRNSSFLLAALLGVNPILTYVALHEFHPEAFSAPLLLLMYLSWAKRRAGWYWVSTLLLLSCKENLALLVITWSLCRILDLKDKRDWWLWKGGLLVISCGWLAIYAFWLGPKWNAGGVDFGALYTPLKTGPFFSNILSVLSRSLQGNLLWILLIPFLFLPLRKPMTLLPALPILFQHLLSWRSSEWTVYFHYAAPLLPFFWLATVEALQSLGRDGRMQHLTNRVPIVLLGTNLLCLIWLGTPTQFSAPFFAASDSTNFNEMVVKSIPDSASVVAPLPWLSHLAQRREVYSLHLVLKGLKTLSKTRYQPPPPTDVVVVDYTDASTFDSTAGYYHPQMMTKTGEVVPSSDLLLHQFLENASWSVTSINEITVFRKTSLTSTKSATLEKSAPLMAGVVDSGTDLISISALPINGGFKIVSKWSFRTERRHFPWMKVAFVDPSGGGSHLFTRGLCCPEGKADERIWEDVWEVKDPLFNTAKTWKLAAGFEDHPSQVMPSAPDRSVIVPIPIELGN